MEAIVDIAQRNGLKVIEDCAQAFGAQYEDRQVGTFGVAGCFSFFPSKILGALGDGGIVTTNDADVAEKCRAIRAHGSRRKYHYELHGLNSRLDALQAAVLRVKLKHVDDGISQRISIAQQYEKALAPFPIELPAADGSLKHVFNYYTMAVQDCRDELQQHLTEDGIGNAIYYPLRTG
jgi:dTDP-4-amino-4,6-dideoxygalactose transaminase